MELSENNYFSEAAQLEYMGSSQFKAFETCEAAALAEVRGEYVRPVTPALLLGSYVDAYFSGTVDSYMGDHPEMFTRDGRLKAEYERANKAIQRVERDPFMMRYLDGEKQVIRTGKIEGAPVKIKMDVYHPGQAIVDLKYVRDFEPVWSVAEHSWLHWIDAWGYDVQGAIYQAVEGHGLPFLIAAVTKESEPDIGLFEVPQEVLDQALRRVRSKIRRYQDVKEGKVEPYRCGRCDWCKATKVITEAVDYRYA